jgi:hypothetical protein
MQVLLLPTTSAFRELYHARGCGAAFAACGLGLAGSGIC